MTPINIFKKSKKDKASEISEGRKVEEKPETALRPKLSASDFVITRPHISEKSTKLRDFRQYAFVIRQKANKTEVKKAIESIFGVNIEKIRILNLPGKVKRLGRSEGWIPGHRKAIVTLKEGQKIELG